MNKKLFFIFPCALFLLTFAYAKKVPTAILSADTLFFSPNKDGAQDQINFEVQTSKVKSIRTWEVQFRDATGGVRKTISGIKEPPQTFSWDGLDDFGAPCSEGTYEVSLKIWPEKGPQINAPSLGIVLDLTPPTISLTSSDKQLHIKDNVVAPTTFYFSAVDLSGISTWELHLMGENKQELFVHSSTGILPISWLLTGQDIKIPKEAVTAILSVTDLAGNRSSSPPLTMETSSEEPGKPVAAEKKQVPEKPEKRLPPAQAAEPVQKKETSAHISGQETQSYQGPFLQLTSIISVSDLFGKDAQYGSALLEEAAILLTPLANALLETPGARANILGHVDSRKNEQEARALSSYFSWRVFSFFVKQKGVDRKTVSVKGLGSAVPIAGNNTRLGRTRNRRIEIQIFLPSETIKK